MNPTLSVVICAHNPRPHYLNRVLNGLKNQTLPLSEWELLLIDNASKRPLAAQLDLNWHPTARCIVENELGLTAARLRGIDEACGHLIVFVDDDNVLAADYLKCAVQIANERPYVGAFGGSCEAEFETPPEPWVHRHLHKLAIRHIERDTWSNLLFFNDGTPFGAGLCVRRFVALDYRTKVLSCVKRRALDRVGTGTGSSGDVDLAYCSIDLGMGTGTFCRLKLIHLIPEERLTVAYISRLSAGMTASAVVLRSFRPSLPDVHRRGQWLNWILFVGKLILSSKNSRKIAIATRSGYRTGQEFLQQTVADRTLIQH
jgi:GT2 family glycosyltransferase